MVVSNDHSYPQHTSPSNFGHETNPFQSDQMGNFFLHHPLLNQDPYTSIPPLNNEAVTSYLSNCSNEAAMAALSSSKKDRHTKIATAQGFRDRRVRLSMDVAREFFELQDLLGFDKPSKTLGWLIAKSKGAIQELALEKQVLDFHESFSFNTTEDAIGNPSSGIPNRSRRKSYKLEEVEKANCNNINGLVVKDNRAKARARARERTRERLIGLSSSSRLVDSKAQVLNQVCDEVESNCLIESHDLSRLVDCITDYQLGSARVNHLPNLSNPELTFSSFSGWSTFTSPTAAEMN